MPAAILALAAALSLTVLSLCEHTRNIRPSTIINAYLLFTLLFDAAQVRTKWIRGDDSAASGALTSVLAIKLFVLISEAIEKRRILSRPYADPSPEATSGLYSRGLFWWLNSLFRLGFRNVVNDDDLFAVDRDLQSKALGERFDKHWAQRKCAVARAHAFKSDLVCRQQISSKAQLSLGHIPGHARTLRSCHCTTASVDILLIHATSPHPKYHNTDQRA